MTPIALTVAGSDSGAGAGIQADLKTFAALGVYGASAITAITAQNTQGVRAIHDVPPNMVEAQIDAVFDDLAVGAVKIGMLSRVAAIAAVAAALRRNNPSNIVLDPVMVATSGARLIATEAVAALREQLLPIALIVTPNLAEAAALTGASEAYNDNEMEVQARSLLAQGARNVLVKGGHRGGKESVDILVSRDVKDTFRFAAPRVTTRNTHGTGCTLSSAIAAGLAKGLSLFDSVQNAKSYVTSAIAAADELDVGRGHGPLHHFHACW